MNAFQRHMMRDAVDLIQAAHQDNKDAAAEIIGRTDPDRLANLAWTLANVAAATIAEHGPVSAFAETVLAQVEREEFEHRENVARMMAVFRPKEGTDA